MTTLFCNNSTWLFCLYICATWLLCATYILYEYFVHLYSTWLLCLFYAAILCHIYSKWLLCSASVLRGYSANIYILYGYSVLHSTWQLCLHIFYACPALHIFIFSASLTALISVYFAFILQVQHWIPLHPIPEALKSILSTAPKITGNCLLAISNYTFWIYQDPTGHRSCLPY